MPVEVNSLTIVQVATIEFQGRGHPYVHLALQQPQQSSRREGGKWEW